MYIKKIKSDDVYNGKWLCNIQAYKSHGFVGISSYKVGSIFMALFIMAVWHILKLKKWID